MKGKSNRLGGSVDLVLLPRIPKGLQVLVARMGDLVILSFATMEDREWNPQSSPEVEDDYLYPSQISSCWSQLTLSLRPVRVGVSGSQVTRLGVSSRAPQRLRTGNRGLHHSGLWPEFSPTNCKGVQEYFVPKLFYPSFSSSNPS
jgi:hypothetical protein